MFVGNSNNLIIFYCGLFQYCYNDNGMNIIIKSILSNENDSGDLINRHLLRKASAEIIKAVIDGKKRMRWKWKSCYDIKDQALRRVVRELIAVSMGTYAAVVNILWTRNFVWCRQE